MFFSNVTFGMRADFFKITNDWFDLFNSRRKHGKTIESYAYGVDLERQNELLNRMSFFIKNVKVGKHKALLPFQKEILLNNKSLQTLFTYLQENDTTDAFNNQYILTNTLNQDVLENLFSYLKGMGAGHDKSSALQLKYRLKWYMGKSIELSTFDISIIKKKVEAQ